MKSLIAAISIVVGVCLASILLGAIVYYWKEYTPHFEAGAVASLGALHTIQDNYKAEKGFFAASFSELGVPQGATLQGTALTWHDGYIYQLSDLTFSSSGHVSAYVISARPVRYQRGSRRSYLEDEGGTIFATREDRPANHNDPIIVRGKR